MKADLSLFAKGVAMGAANVIPGVSGGTIALITGIYERLINALKSGDITSLKLLLSGKFSDFWQRIDGRWLSILIAGVAISIVTLAKLFEYLLEHHEQLTMAFFFGLILVSISRFRKCKLRLCVPVRCHCHQQYDFAWAVWLLCPDHHGQLCLGARRDQHLFPIDTATHGARLHGRTDRLLTRSGLGIQTLSRSHACADDRLCCRLSRRNLALEKRHRRTGHESRKTTQGSHRQL